MFLDSGIFLENNDLCRPFILIIEVGLPVHGGFVIATAISLSPKDGVLDLLSTRFIKVWLVSV